MSISTTLKQGTDLYFLYSFIRRLTLPFKDTKAFELGIIDDKGKVLKKRSTLKTAEERASYTLMDTMIFNLKKIMAKVPFGATRFAAALFLLKENKNIKMFTDEKLLQEKFEQFYNDRHDKVEFISEGNATLNIYEQLEFISEEVPANATGTAVAGTGDDSSTVVIRRKKKKITDIKYEDKEVDPGSDSASMAFKIALKKSYRSKNINNDKLKAKISNKTSEGV